MNEDRTCPYCGGTAVVLGNLGKKVFYRCINCGIQFSVHPKKDVKRRAKARRQARQFKDNIATTGE